MTQLFGDVPGTSELLGGYSTNIQNLFKSILEYDVEEFKAHFYQFNKYLLSDRTIDGTLVGNKGGMPGLLTDLDTIRNAGDIHVDSRLFPYIVIGFYQQHSIFRILDILANEGGTLNERAAVDFVKLVLCYSEVLKQKIDDQTIVPPTPILNRVDPELCATLEPRYYSEDDLLQIVADIGRELERQHTLNGVQEVLADMLNALLERAMTEEPLDSDTPTTPNKTLH